VTCSISLHYIHNPGYSDPLQDSYDNQLNEFATVFVEDIILEKVLPMEYRTEVLAPFECLDISRILFTQKNYFNASYRVQYSDDAAMSDEKSEYADQLKTKSTKACSDHPRWRDDA
jgi:hypothetical protein